MFQGIPFRKNYLTPRRGIQITKFDHQIDLNFDEIMESGQNFGNGKLFELNSGLKLVDSTLFIPLEDNMNVFMDL